VVGSNVVLNLKDCLSFKAFGQRLGLRERLDVRSSENLNVLSLLNRCGSSIILSLTMNSLGISTLGASPSFWVCKITVSAEAAATSGDTR
jgi:hypothetical protein